MIYPIEKLIPGTDRMNHAPECCSCSLALQGAYTDQLCADIQVRGDEAHTQRQCINRSQLINKKLGRGTGREMSTTTCFHGGNITNHKVFTLKALVGLTNVALSTLTK